jgi:hypothetical protein
MMIRDPSMKIPSQISAPSENFGLSTGVGQSRALHAIVQVSFKGTAVGAA